MSFFIILQSIVLHAPDGTPLVGDCSLSFGAERTGLVGPNGCGKSTLLDVLKGERAPTSGTVTCCATVSHLVQRWPDPRQRVANALGVRDRLDRLSRIEAGAGNERDFAEADWSLPARLRTALARAGLPSDVAGRVLGELSGGQQTRVGLARLYLEASDFLLLDEPTNNLDAQGRALIHELVVDWPGGVVVASHDRDLLERMDRIVELSRAGPRLSGGGWAAYAQARAARHARAASAAQRTTREVERVARETQRQRERKARRDRGGAARRARRDQPKVLLDARAERAAQTAARDRRLAERLADDAARARELARSHLVRRPDLNFRAVAASTHGRILRLERVTVRRGGFSLGPIDLEISAGERVVLSGPNGSGKSTLFALIRGEIAQLSGRVLHSAAIAALDQQVADFDPAGSLIDNLRRCHPALTFEAACTLLARHGFRNVMAHRRMGELSGGERLRAGLAATLGGTEPPALLMLDEPTNHLDIETVELLEQTLRGFAGALLIASHDRMFLEAIAPDRHVVLAAG